MTASYQPTTIADDFSADLSVKLLMLYNNLSMETRYKSMTDADLLYALFKTCARYLASAIKQTDEMESLSGMQSVVSLDSLVSMVNETRFNMENADEDTKQRVESMLKVMGIVD